MVRRIVELMNNMEGEAACDFKKVDKSRVDEETKRVNSVLKYIETKSISETNKLLKAVSICVAERLGIKNKRGSKRNNEPWWKRRIENDIDILRKDIAILERKKRGELRREGKFSFLQKKYNVNRKGLAVVIEELKQRVTAKKAKLNRYEQRIKQYRQNRLFYIDQKRFYQEINGETRKEKILPNAEESRKFWGEIWDNAKEHNKQAEWLQQIKETETYPVQENMHISKDKVEEQCRKMPNWKAPGPDGVQGFWVKKLTACHQRIAEQMDKILNGQEELPEWMTKGRTVLCQKDPTKGNAVDNFRPISCLPLLWKLMTGIIAESMYGFLESNNILPNEQKGCKRESRGTKDQLLIDKMVLKDSKRRHTNLAMAWIDYRKAYDMVPHSWIIECLEIFGIARNVERFIHRSMAQWKTELTSCGESLGHVDIRRGIFQGDSLSPLLFVLCLIPLSLILRKVKAAYEFKERGRKINHLLFMDDLKLYGKSDTQIDSLVKTVHLFSKDIGMEFGVKKCGVSILKRGKVVDYEGVLLPDGELMKVVENDGYKYLGILEIDGVMEDEMKMKFRKEYLRRLRSVLKSKLNGRNKFQAINTWAVASLRYGAGIIKWNKEELQNLDRKSRKLLTLYGAFHPKSDVDRLYLPRSKGGRGLISCESCIRSEENSVGFYMKNSMEPLLEQVRMSGVIQTEECLPKEQYKKEKTTEKEQNWKEKKMYGQYCREASDDIDKNKMWRWLQKSDLKVETEALICAAQEQAIRTNYIKFNIDKTVESPLCRMCGEKGESIGHVVSECEKLAQREYKRRHDNVARIVHWTLCGKYDLERETNWYEHSPQGVVESDKVKMLWDFMIQCDHYIECRKPDIVVVEKEEKKCIIIDIAIPGDNRVGAKEKEKIEKYDNLKWEVKKMWSMKKVEIVPVVIGALGAVSKNFELYIEKLGIQIKTEHLQKTALLGTARILRRTLEN